MRRSVAIANTNCARRKLDQPLRRFLESQRGVLSIGSGRNNGIDGATQLGVKLYYCR